MEKLVVYGSFNCPQCYLESTYVDLLSGSSDVAVEWRAVVHYPALPMDGVPVDGILAAQLDREIADVIRRSRGSLEIHRPRNYPDTTLAVATFAAAEDSNVDRLRRALFRAYWVDGLDIGDQDVVKSLAGLLSFDAKQMHEWRRAWLAMAHGQATGVLHSHRDDYTSRRLEELCSYRASVSCAA